MRWVALLRGVNIGSRQMKMAELRALLVDFGFEDVVTYLQSGNAVFTAPDVDRGELRSRLEDGFADRFGFAVPTIVLGIDTLSTVVEACPYRAHGDADPTKVHVVFVEPMPAPGAWTTVESGVADPEEYALGDGVVYMHLPEGMGRARLPGLVDRATRDVVATTRNWRTVVNLGAML